MDLNKNNFKCVECGKDRLYSYFRDLSKPEELINKCYYCQTGTKESVRNYKKDPDTDERKCIRCRVIRHQDQFIWTAKDGQRTKEVKTCVKCRDTDKNLRTKHKTIKKDKTVESLVIRKLKKDE